MDSFSDKIIVENHIFTFKNKPILIKTRLSFKNFVSLIDSLHDNGYSKTKELTDLEYVEYSNVNKETTYYIDEDKFEYIMKIL